MRSLRTLSATTFIAVTALISTGCVIHQKRPGTTQTARQISREEANAIAFDFCRSHGYAFAKLAGTVRDAGFWRVHLSQRMPTMSADLDVWVDVNTGYVADSTLHRQGKTSGTWSQNTGYGTGSAATPAPRGQPAPPRGTPPAQPAARPAQPATRPAQPATRPAQPAARPAQPAAAPAQPATRPTGTATPARPAATTVPPRATGTATPAQPTGTAVSPRATGVATPTQPAGTAVSPRATGTATPAQPAGTVVTPRRPSAVGTAAAPSATRAPNTLPGPDSSEGRFDKPDPTVDRDPVQGKHATSKEKRRNERLKKEKEKKEKEEAAKRPPSVTVPALRKGVPAG